MERFERPGIGAIEHLTAVAALALVVASAVLAGREATGSATLALPFLSAQPCVVVLTLIPSVIGLVAIRLARWPRLPPSA